MLLEPLQLSTEETVYKSGKGDSTSLNIEVLYRKHKRGFLTISVTVVESKACCAIYYSTQYLYRLRKRVENILLSNRENISPFDLKCVLFSRAGGISKI